MPVLAFAQARLVDMHREAGTDHIFEHPLWREAPGHLLGTARMGNDPETSVVDAWGEAHDVPNLYIVDGSVMVTSGTMNPTATITALALRTAEHIVQNALGIGVAA